MNLFSSELLSNPRSVDGINIVMIGIAWAVALLVPFHLFLFAYAVLGPLHYLTEIVWLRERRYFLARDVLPITFVGIAILCTLLLLWGMIMEWMIAAVIFFLFGLAGILTLLNSSKHRWIGIILLCVGVFFLAWLQPAWYTLIFVLLLPTLIHVLVFTGVFMWVGAYKSRSNFGKVAFVLFLLAAGSLLFIVPSGITPELSQYVRENYATFAHLNAALLAWLPGSETSLEAVFTSPAGITVMQLIAFAYTYHYLNWFSKVKIIGWQVGSRAVRLGIIVLWFGALTLYWYDYQAGLQTLFFLSFLHVLLEFPLNHRSFLELGKSIFVRLS